MNKNIKNILKEKIIINNLLKNHIYKIIQKSLTQNNNIHNKIKIYNNYLTVKGFFFKSTLSKKHKVCLITGKRAPIIHNTTFSRYTVKNMILSNKLTNFKKNNW